MRLRSLGIDYNNNIIYIHFVHSLSEMNNSKINSYLKHITIFIKRFIY